MPTSDFIVIIPARMGSSRFPGKPLADLCGKPMVVRTAERCLESSAKRVVVATDYADILDVCHAHGIEAVMTGSHASGTDRVAEAVRILYGL